MVPTRVIPCLLLKNRGFYKTRQFASPVYLGDPINILKIFNEKEVYEIVILDISDSARDHGPDFEYLSELASECFMPLAYGGGIKNVEQAKKILEIGFEKVVLNSAPIERPELITEISNQFGSQSVVISIDVKRSFFGASLVMTQGGRKKTKLDPAAWAKKVESLGAGEIIITSIDREGTMQGYDLELIRKITNTVQIPVVAHGGAGGVHDFKKAIQDAGASAVAAGSLFVFHGPMRGVLISFPSKEKLKSELG